MAKIRIYAQYDPRSSKFYTQVIPGPGSGVRPFRSDPMFDNTRAAERFGMLHLERVGVRNIDWHKVDQLLA